jgi:transposase
MSNHFSSFIGIDVSKKKLDVFVSKSNKFIQVSNNKEGIASLIKSFTPSDTLLVVIDLTGGYEDLVVETFVSKGFNVHRAEGRKVRYFSSSYGQKAKTDKIDARMLTIYADKMQETLRLYSHQDNYLKQLQKRRQDIKNIIQQEKNRKEHSSDIAVERSIDNVIKYLTEQLGIIEQKMKDYVKNNELLSKKIKIISSVPAIGEQTAMTLLGNFSQLGQINRRQLAALAGLAPYPKDSGSISKKRRTSHGRACVKHFLFMCALTASRLKSSPLKAFYEKLLSVGKPKIVALVAVMRKLLIIVNNRCKVLYINTNANRS